MQRRPFAPPRAAVIAVALATIMLGGCGPGETSTPTAAAANMPARPEAPAHVTTQAPGSAAPPPGVARAPASASTDTVANGFGASSPDTANAAASASDAVQSAQASLAADSEQIAPVLSYAPGDGPPQQTTASNDSSSTATTNQ
jgi:hypothetical protein